MTEPAIREVRGLAPPKSRALCFLDLEYLGFGKRFGRLQPVSEVSVIKRRGLPPYDHETLDVQVQISDFELQHADKEALRVNGYEPALWAETAKTKLQAFALVHDMIASHTVVGFNVVGDLLHLESEFDCCGFKLVRHWCDAVDLSTLLRHAHPEWGAWDLATACARYAIEGEGVHRSLGGATRTMQCWDKLMEECNG